jgi:hypothetical protein
MSIELNPPAKVLGIYEKYPSAGHLGRIHQAARSILFNLREMLWLSANGSIGVLRGYSLE